MLPYATMRVTRDYSHKQILHDYTPHQQTLENVQSIKYIDILTITDNRVWVNIFLKVRTKQEFSACTLALEY